MVVEMSKGFEIPVDPTPQEMNMCLIICANNIARVQELVSEYKANVAIKQTAYKRAMAKALVLHQGEKNATLTKAMAELEPFVLNALDELDQATALYTVGQGELEGYEAQFVALRKIVEIKKLEIQGRLDNYTT